MEKKLYFKFSDNYDVTNVVMDLSACMAWIEGEELAETDDKEYTLVPIWLTDEEYQNIPQADCF